MKARRTKLARRSDREKQREREGKRDSEEDRKRERERGRDYRTSKIGRRRKRRAEQSREEKREGRKEGRKDAGVSAFWQTNASIPGGSSTESVSVSLFLFRSSSTPPCVSRVAAALPISLSPPRARPSPHHSPWAATGASLPSPLHSSCYREPRPTAFFLIHPARTLSPRASLPQAALLAVTTRSPPPDKDKLRCIFRTPKSSNVLRHFPPPPSARTTSALDPRLPPSTELASYVARPSSRHFPRLCPDHPPRPPRLSAM